MRGGFARSVIECRLAVVRGRERLNSESILTECLSKFSSFEFKAARNIKSSIKSRSLPLIAPGSACRRHFPIFDHIRSNLDPIQRQKRRKEKKHKVSLSRSIVNETTQYRLRRSIQWSWVIRHAASISVASDLCFCCFSFHPTHMAMFLKWFSQFL